MKIARRQFDHSHARFSRTSRAKPGKAAIRLQHRLLRVESLESRQLLAGDIGWSQPFGDLELDSVYEIATDDQNNAYVALRFAGAVDLDPDASYPDGRDLISVPISAYGVAVAKFSSEGELLWSHVGEGQDGSLPGTQSSTPKDIQVHDDGVYVVGSLNDLWDFDQGNPETDSLVNHSGTGAGSFIMKLDAMNGDFAWVRGLGITEAAVMAVDPLAVDPDGNAYVSILLREGSTIGDEIVPPLPAGDHAAIVEVTSAGIIDGYHRLSATEDLSTPAIEFQPSQTEPTEWKLFIGAGFEGDLTLDGTYLASSLDDRDAFVGALDSSLAPHWAQRYELPKNQYPKYLSVAGSSLYAAGELGVDSSDGTGSPLVGDRFVFRLATDDGDLLSSTAMGDGAEPTAVINSLQAIPDGVLIGGYFDETITVGGASMSSVDGSLDPFFAILDENLQAVTTRNYGGPAIDYQWEAHMDATGAVIVGGSFRETANLPLIGNVTSVGGGDAYLARIELDSSGGPPPNTAPIAISDDYTVEINSPLTVETGLGVLANDFDPEGDALTAFLVSPPSSGSLVLSADGSFAYTPAVGFVGSDSFVYQAHDGILDSLETTVNIQVTPASVTVFQDSFEVATWDGNWVEDSQNDWFRSTQRSTEGSYSAEIDGYALDASLTLASPIDMTGYQSAELSFDWFIESGFDTGEYLAVEVFDGSTWSRLLTLDGNADQENAWHEEVIEIDPQFLQSDFQFRFLGKASRSNEDANVDNVVLVATEGTADLNATPLAVDDLYSIAEDALLEITSPGLLVNDTDSDGDPLTAQLVNGPDFGSLLLNGDGSFSYTPDADFHGLDSFTYQANDGTTNSISATVTINVASVNDAPIAYPQTLETEERGSLNVTLAGSDVDGDSFSYTIVNGPASGSIVGSGEEWIYTPDPGFTGADHFTFKVSDGAADSAEAVVTITVAPAPTGPNLAHGDLIEVASVWQTVSLNTSYQSMVVVATPRYDTGSGPGVVRIHNVTSDSFDVRVDSVGTTAFSGGVHYVVVEEGVYDQPGFKLEAIKYSEVETSGKNNWLIDSVGYQQSYVNPVVVGQVMSANDSEWSVFWASSGSRTSPPTATELNVGKHTGEDPNNDRATETIGYLVIEATQNGTIEGLPFVAGVGDDEVRGVGNGTYQYEYVAMPNAKTAILSSAGMDGGDGGWPALHGAAPLPAAGGTIALVVDEDQLGDSERNHTTEQVAYFVIDPPLVNEPLRNTGQNPPPVPGRVGPVLLPDMMPIERFEMADRIELRAAEVFAKFQHLPTFPARLVETDATANELDAIWESDELEELLAESTWLANELALRPDLDERV